MPNVAASEDAGSSKLDLLILKAKGDSNEEGYRALQSQA